MRTIKEFKSRGYIVPAGSPCHKACQADQDGTYAIFVDPTIYPEGSFERHDATYYGLRVEPSNVEHDC